MKVEGSSINDASCKCKECGDVARVCISIGNQLQQVGLCEDCARELREKLGSALCSQTDYEPKCKFGYDDCIYDPAYIEFYYPDWYEELKASGGFSCVGCEGGNRYDDEDK